MLQLPKLSYLLLDVVSTKLLVFLISIILLLSWTSYTLPRESLIHYYIHIRSILLLSFKNSEISLEEITTITSNSGIVLAKNWLLHFLVDKDTKSFNSSLSFLYKLSWDFCKKNVSVIPFFLNGGCPSKHWILKEKFFLNSSMMISILLKYLLSKVVHGFNTLITLILSALELLELLSIMLLLANTD